MLTLGTLFLHLSGTKLLLPGLSQMRRDPIARFVLYAQDVIWEHLPPDEPQERAVAALRRFFGRAIVRRAIAEAPDSIFSMYARATATALWQNLADDQDAFSAVLRILDDPPLNEALGLPADYRIKIDPGHG